MEWFGVFAFIMVLAYAGYPNKTKDLEKRLKKLEKNQKGENIMSKLIGDLVDKECVLETDAALQISGSTKLKCHVLDTDEEWIKVEYTDKKNNVVTKLLRVENIDEIEIVE